MRVNTRGISITVGVVIVLALGAAWLRVVREESTGPAAEEQCVSQPREQARVAQQRFTERFLEPEADDGGPAWYAGDGLSRRGAIADDVLPASVGDDWVLLVLYVDGEELPRLPACIEDTPVAYVTSGDRIRPD